MAITAMHEGRCGDCGERIYEGDSIEQVDGEWCHEECAEPHLAAEEENEPDPWKRKPTW